MGIVFNGGVINSGGTPQAITGIIADRPAATNVAEGTIYISTDTQEIFSAQAGSWVKVSGTGGGGSQNIDQVLAVGNTATSKVLNFISTNFAGQYDQTNSALNYTSGQSAHNAVTRVNQNFSKIFRTTFVNSLNVFNEFDTEADTAGKNYFFLQSSDNNNVNILRRFYVESALNTSNYFELLEASFNGYISKIVGTAIAGNGSGTYLDIVDDDNNNNFCATVRVRANSDGQAGQGYLEFINNNTGWIQQIFAGIGFFNQNLFNQFPTWSGDIANVNEKIVQTGITLSGGDFNCQFYGAYHVKTGSNTNNFDLTNFANNGLDGQFVTIMAEDTPIICINNVGQIFGTANINNKGLYKLMLFQNNIYSSNI